MKKKIHELDLVLAKKTQQYKRLKESREQSERKILDESSISQNSNSNSSIYSKPGSRIHSAKKTFVTNVRNYYKPSEGVSIYKPNIPHPREASKPTSATPSKTIALPENIDLDFDSLSHLSKDEQERLSKLMLECKEVLETPKNEEVDIKALVAVPKTPCSILKEDAASRLDEIDETLRQLVPIDKWDQWSLKTSIRSITAGSFMAESAPSRILETENTLKPLSLKKKYKNVKPREKFLREMSEKKETMNLMKEIDKKISNMRREHMKLQGITTEEEKAV